MFSALWPCKPPGLRELACKVAEVQLNPAFDADSRRQWLAYAVLCWTRLALPLAKPLANVVVAKPRLWNLESLSSCSDAIDSHEKLLHLRDRSNLTSTSSSCVASEFDAVKYAREARRAYDDFLVFSVFLVFLILDFGIIEQNREAQRYQP